MKQRILLLDLFRIISAFIVFVFHLNTHFGFVIPDALGLNPIIKTGAVFMVLFFTQSGFGLTISSNTKYSDGWNLKNYKDFIVRRLLNIMPLYYVFLIWVFITKYSWTNTIEEMFSLLPSFITLTQAFFPATFNRLGGGYLVFISIIIYVYMLSHDRLFSKIYIIQVKAVYFNGCTYFGNHLSRNSKGILGRYICTDLCQPHF